MQLGTSSRFTGPTLRHLGDPFPHFPYLAQLYSELLGLLPESFMHAVFSPFLKNLPSLPVRLIRTPIFTKVLITAPTRDLGSFNF